MSFLVVVQIFRWNLMTAKHRLTLAVLCFYSKTGFWPAYCQISTDLDKFWTQNILVGRLRPRSASGWLQAKPERLCFCFCNTCNAPLVLYRNEGSPRFRQQTIKAEVRTGAIVKKVWNFVEWAEPNPKTAFFAFLGYPSTIVRTGYRKQFYSKPMVPMESRNFEDVPFASLESLWPGIWQI